MRIYLRDCHFFYYFRFIKTTDSLNDDYSIPEQISLFMKMKSGSINFDNLNFSLYRKYMKYYVVLAKKSVILFFGIMMLLTGVSIGLVFGLCPTNNKHIVG